MTGFAETPRGILPIDGVLIVPYVVFFLWSGYNAILLEKKKPSFIPSFLTFLVLGPVLSVSTPFLWQQLSGVTPASGALSSSASSVLVAWGLWALIWAPYVAYSTRLNVTLLHRVRRPSKPVVTVAPTQQQALAMPTAAAHFPGVDPGDESVWAAALQEFDSDKRKTGLWATLYAEFDGNETRAKAAYLKARVGQLCGEPQDQSTSKWF